jgi:hypothetical protein
MIKKLAPPAVCTMPSGKCTMTGTVACNRDNDEALRKFQADAPIGTHPHHGDHARGYISVYPEVSGLAAWSEN